MVDVIRESFAYIAAIIGAAGGAAVAVLRERYKFTQLRLDAGRDDAASDSAAVQAARVDERDQCAKQIAALREDIAELRGRIDEQGAELTDMRHQTYRSDRARLVAEGRAVAMKSLAEGAGADQATVDLIWQRHDPDTIAGRLAT